MHLKVRNTNNIELERQASHLANEHNITQTTNL